MDEKFLMVSNNWLMRSKSAGMKLSTSISPRLHNNLIKASIRKAYEFYSDFFDISISDVDFGKLAVNYERDCSHAISLGLFSPGGIRKKDHLNLWCLSHIFSPEVYVESGVFIGSSLHAFISSPRIRKIIAIDPNLKKLKLSKESIPGAELIENKDFSQITFDISGMKSLVYFDDHIDTASRIFQASEKGFRFVLFDDSTGLEGICQRLYPAIPTIPMIMNADLLSPGDELSWAVNNPSKIGLKGLVKKIIQRKSDAAGTRVTLVITQELIDKCFEAKKLIRKYKVLPNLGEFIPQLHPEFTPDTSKFIVELDLS